MLGYYKMLTICQKYPMKISQNLDWRQSKRKNRYQQPIEKKISKNPYQYTIEKIRASAFSSCPSPVAYQQTTARTVRMDRQLGYCLVSHIWSTRTGKSGKSAESWVGYIQIRINLWDLQCTNYSSVGHIQLFPLMYIKDGSSMKSSEGGNHLCFSSHHL